MLEQFRDGLLGFVLVVSSWLSPDSGEVGIRVRSVDVADSVLTIGCAMELGWNEQMTQLVDAGIPVRFLLSIATDAADTVVFLRTLRFDVGDDAYSFTDSSVAGAPGPQRSAKGYPQILVALRDFRRWTYEVSPHARAAHLEAELLRSPVSRLNRSVDMSAVWGQRKVSLDILLREQPVGRQGRGRGTR